MLRVRLFDAIAKLGQQLLVGFWLLNIALVLVLWLTTTEFRGGTSVLLDAIGMLFGLLATYFALTQFMLLGRIAWVERPFGLDRLARYHRLNGYLALIFILIHPIFITISYALESHTNLFQQYFNLVFGYQYVWLAFIAQLLFVAVVVSSIYIARRRLKFETWYFVHLMVYAAIAIVPFHQLAIGDSFIGGEHPLARLYWLSLYGFVGLNLFIWRFALPIISLLRYDFRIDKVVTETPTTTSIYIRGRGLTRWQSKPGQFVLIRVLMRGFWWQEHPFSLSWIPHDNMLRVTIRHVGDYTTMLSRLIPGTRVVVSGPFGRFTSDVAKTNKRLFIAGGVGITPLRSLAEQAVNHELDSVLVYGNKTTSDVVFKKEIDELENQGLRVDYSFSQPPKSSRGVSGHIDAGYILATVPDAFSRDIYLCGPPAMMESLVNGLTDAGLQPERVHYERFTLHS